MATATLQAGSLRVQSFSNRGYQVHRAITVVVAGCGVDLHALGNFHQPPVFSTKSFFYRGVYKPQYLVISAFCQQFCFCSPASESRIRFVSARTESNGTF